MSIEIQKENIDKINQTNIELNAQLTLNEEDTQVLKEKMKQLQQEIHALQKLKQSKNYSQRKSVTSKNQKSVDNQKPKTQNEQQYGSASVISQNLKNSKINDLVSQLSFKDEFPTKRKRSWSRTIPPQSQRNSVRNLKQTLQKIDISQQKKTKKIAAKIFSQKKQSNNVQSNIFNVTIAEIMAGQITKKQEEKVKMLSEIVDLKSKIKELTTQKQKKSKQIQENIYQSPVQQTTARLPIKTNEFSAYLEQKTQRSQNNINQWSLTSSESNKFGMSFKKIPERTQINQFMQTQRSNENTFRSEISGTGKLYSRSRILKPKNYGEEDYQSITTLQYQPQNNAGHSIQLKRNTNPFTWNPQITLTLPQQSYIVKQNEVRSGRIYSSIQMQRRNQYSEQRRQQRIKPIFNIMKKKKIALQQKREEQNSEIIKKTQQKVENKLEERPIQKPKKEFKKPQQRLNQIKMDKMKNEPYPPKDLLPNFRQYIDEKLLTIKLTPTPTIQFGQSQLQQLGRSVFEMFDIFVDQEIQKKGIQYKVTKYKNCVLFRLNEEKNIVWYFDGRFYFGGWEIGLTGQAKKQGFGFQVIPNKFIYQGFFKSSKREGYGIMSQIFQTLYQNKIIYQGFWKQGIKDGRGYQIESQLQYLGDFKLGLQTGECKIKTQQTLYEGQIKDSAKVGKGHEILRNGDEYYGDFENNTFNGTGQYRWKSGAYFYGNFVNGTRKGQGIWISNIFSLNFDIYKGSYEENKKNGYGVYQWANGTIYDGYFKNDLRHDEGLMIFPNGKAAKFIWKDGVKTIKLYCEQEQTYRRSRNSPRKVPQDGQNEQQLTLKDKEQTNQNRSQFSSQVLNELQNINLHLFSLKKASQQKIFQ